MKALDQVDPDIAEIIRAETERQSRNLELIASENFVSEAVLEAVGSVLTKSTRRGIRAGAITAAARSSTGPRSSRSRAPASCSAPSTSMSSHTRARRRTWPCTSRCSSLATPCSA